jgi:hypothetical protein
VPVTRIQKTITSLDFPSGAPLDVWLTCAVLLQLMMTMLMVISLAHAELKTM